MISAEAGDINPKMIGFHQKICENIRQVELNDVVSDTDRKYIENINEACNSGLSTIVLSGSINFLLERLFQIGHPTVLRATLALLPRDNQERDLLNEFLNKHESEFRARMKQDGGVLSQILIIRYVYDMYISRRGTSLGDIWHKELTELIGSWKDSSHPLSPYIDVWAYLALGLDSPNVVSFPILTQKSDTLLGNMSLKKLWSLKEVLKSAEAGKGDVFDNALKGYHNQYGQEQNGSVINLLYHSRFIDAIQKYPTLLESAELSIKDKDLLDYIIFFKKYIGNIHQENIPIETTIEKFEQAIFLLQSKEYNISQEMPPTLVDIFSKVLFTLSREHSTEVERIFEKYPRFFDQGVIYNVYMKIIDDRKKSIHKNGLGKNISENSLDTNDHYPWYIQYFYTMNLYQRGILYSLIIFSFLVALYVIIGYIRKS